MKAWSAPRLEFRQMLQADTPTNKLAVILATAKSVSVIQKII